MQAERDGYVGYVADTALDRSRRRCRRMSSSRRALSSIPGPDLKLPRTEALSMGSRVTVADLAETRGTRYALLPSGEAMIAGHLEPLGER